MRSSRPRAGQTGAQTEKQKLSLGVAPFGTESPSFTIAGHHMELWHPLDTPGPADYAPSPRIRRYYHRIQGGPPVWPPHPTANVDMFDLRVGQWRTPITTEPPPPPRKPLARDALGANFIPPPTLSPRPIRIKAYFPPLDFRTVTPGPAAYDPSDGHCGLSYSISSPVPRDDWLRDGMPESPVPGTYSAPLSRGPRPPSWTIGGKSRRKRGWGRREPPADRTVMVGNFAVRVGEDDYDYALRAVQDDLILKRMIKWVMERVLAEKPQAPLARMRQYFAVVRKAVDPTYVSRTGL